MGCDRQLIAGVNEPGPPDLYQKGMSDERARVRRILHQNLDYFRGRIESSDNALDAERCQCRLELIDHLLNSVLLGSDPRELNG